MKNFPTHDYTALKNSLSLTPNPIRLSFVIPRENGNPVFKSLSQPKNNLDARLRGHDVFADEHLTILISSAAPLRP
jgi:hypothetical protein